ncbi:MAG: MFS transporter [Rickettsiaceae bacterium]|jgi:PAT family beta-lactamase induction signal transducer AmpG|nr:MFS transporter [Rickettsiaceae bacterium]
MPRKNFLIVWLFGLMSGFTIMLSGYTLNYWLSFEKIDIRTIGAFSLVSLPYAINFTWAPLFDTKKIPILYSAFGQRLSWLLLVQLLLSAAVYLISTFDPTEELLPIALSGLLISIFASAQDSILGALRTELVDKRHQGEISGMYIFGYRIGMLLSSSGAIYISQYMRWNLVYELFSMVLITFPIVLILQSKDLASLYTKFNNEIIEDSIKHQGHFLRTRSFIKKILKPIGSNKYILFVIIFLILYRLPDNFISMMITPFLHHIGYDSFEIATAGKLFGAISAMIGGLLASYIMRKKPLYDSLLLFGSIHAAAHVLFVLQDAVGKNIYLLFLITGFEGISGGMTMAAYIAFIASLCDGRFRATQYSFFSSMMGLSRSILPSISGYFVANFGWTVFYLFTTVATVPALVIIVYLEKMKKN